MSRSVIVYYDFEVESVDTEEAASVRGVTVIEPRQGAAVVELRGDHDLSTQPELNELLAGLIAGHELVVVDISEATFIDSTFIHGLWLANQAAASRAATFRVQLGTARIVDRVVEISHIGDLIEIVSTREAALAAPPLR